MSEKHERRALRRGAPERETRFELATAALGRRCSTRLSYSRRRPHSNVATATLTESPDPTLLLRGPPTMAVRATDLALLDLGEDNVPTPSPDHDADLHHLRVGVLVIELEKLDVCLTAVGAWMSAQVVM